MLVDAVGWRNSLAKALAARTCWHHPRLMMDFEKNDAAHELDRAHMTEHDDPALRCVVVRVALLNLAYFGVEFAVGLAIGSVSLFADSIDFLEDASVNLLILALGWQVTFHSAGDTERPRKATGSELCSGNRQPFTIM